MQTSNVVASGVVVRGAVVRMSRHAVILAACRILAAHGPVETIAWLQRCVTAGIGDEP
jgi:hypothetical protein